MNQTWEMFIYNDEYFIETSQDYQSKSVQKIVDSFLRENCKICTIYTTVNYYSFWIIEKNKVYRKIFNNRN